MTHEMATDQNGNSINQYPAYRDEGELILIGLIKGKAEYYHREQNRVEMVLKDGEEFETLGSRQLSCKDTVSDHLQLTRETHGGYDALTDYAEAMARAETLAETGAITRDQAEVYALRAEKGVLRKDASKMLGKSPSTLDSLLVKAKDKVKRAEELTRRSVESITFQDEPAPLVEPNDIEEEDLLTTEEFEQFVGESLIQVSKGGYVVLTTPDGSFYVVGSSPTQKTINVAGVVRAREVNEAFGIY